MAKRREIYAGMYVIAFDVILAVAIGLSMDAGMSVVRERRARGPWKH